MAIIQGYVQVISLPKSLAAWGEEGFSDTFRAEVEQLPAERLPLQQGLSLSSCVSTEPFRVMVISSGEESGGIRVKAGIFYSGIIAGCNCSDDPTPMDVQTEYCDLAFIIDKTTSETRVSLFTE